MKSGNFIETIGSITKKESLINYVGEKMKNTTVLEADKPYSDYYGQTPRKTGPHSLFLVTENTYALEEALRFTQNIGMCSKYHINAASAAIYYPDLTVSAIRIRNFPDYNQIHLLQ